MPPSRRQPPRNTPARRPRVAGRTSTPSGSGHDDTATSSPKRPNPRPRPVPKPAHEAPAAPEPEPVESAAAEAAEEPGTPETAEVAEPEGAVEGKAEAGEPARPRPSPRRKARDTGRAKPAGLDEAEAEAVRSHRGEARPVKVADPARRRLMAVVTLLVAGLVLAGAAVFFKIEDTAIDNRTSNTALLDVGRTAQVDSAVKSAAETLFSYDYSNIAKTEDAAKNLLAGDDVRAKYESLIQQVKQLAPQQKLVVTCKATRSAVVMLEGDLAKVMVFIDQTSTRTDTKQTSAGSAQLWMTAQDQNGQWRITGMDTYNSEVPVAPAPASPSPPAPPAPPAGPGH